MRLKGRLIKQTSVMNEAAVERELGNLPFRDVLEDCFITLCRELDIQVPMWLKKNTKEFARFRRTFFPREQFLEKVAFDRLEIRLED